MKNFFRSRYYWIILPHLFLILLLVWTLFVPLDQMDDFSRTGKLNWMAHQASIRENLTQIQLLLWGMIAWTVCMVLSLFWMISRKILLPILALRQTLRKTGRKKAEALHSGKEWDALSDDIHRMMADHESQISHQKALQRTLSAVCACGRELIRETDENRLIQRICNTFIEAGACRTAWIGFCPENEMEPLIPAAAAGISHEMAKSPWPDSVTRTANRAVRNRRPAIDVMGSPLADPLEAEASRMEDGSVLAAPLMTSEGTIGVLALHAGHADAFGTDEVRELSQMADSLAFRIRAIRNSP